ncbi:MAG TPA: hypothetical protein VIR33_03910 [Thermopolyspora sp.]
MRTAEDPAVDDPVAAETSAPGEQVVLRAASRRASPGWRHPALPKTSVGAAYVR